MRRILKPPVLLLLALACACAGDGIFVADDAHIAINTTFGADVTADGAGVVWGRGEEGIKAAMEVLRVRGGSAKSLPANAIVVPGPGD